MCWQDACGTITEALRKELVTVAENQASVFGDVQLGVDVLADDLMWDLCKTDPLIKNGASEEEPEVREMHEGALPLRFPPIPCTRGARGRARQARSSLVGRGRLAGRAARARPCGA